MVDLDSLKLKNLLNIDTDTLTLLHQSLQDYGELDGEFPDRLLHYLVDGEDTAILTDVANAVQQQQQQYQQALQQQTQTAAGALQQVMVNFASFSSNLLLRGSDGTALQQFLRKSKVSAPEFYCRLSHFWSNCLMGNSYGWVMPGSGQPVGKTLNERLLTFLGDVFPPHHYAPPSVVNQDWAFTAYLVDGMYVEEGDPAGSFARNVYIVAPNDYSQKQLASYGPLLKDFADFSLTHAGIIQEALGQSQRERRIHAMEMLLQGKVPIEAFVDTIVTSAVSSAKSEREIAAKLLQKSADMAVPILQAKAESGNSGERQQAIKLLWDLAGEKIKPFLLTRLETDKAAKVKSTIEQLIATPTVEALGCEDSLTLPLIQPVNADSPLPEDAFAILEQLVHESRQAQFESIQDLLSTLKDSQNTLLSEAVDTLIAEEIDQTLAVSKAEYKQLLDIVESFSISAPKEVLQRIVHIVDSGCELDQSTAQLISLLQRGTYNQCKNDNYGIHGYFEKFQSLAKTFLALPSIQLIHAIRLLIMLQQVTNKKYIYNHDLFSYQGHDLLLSYRDHHADCNDLRQLATVLEVLEISPERIGEEMLDAWSYNGFWQWGSDAIWPYFAERVALLENILLPNTETDWHAQYRHRRRRGNGFEVLSTFPQAPAALLSVLWRLAFDGPKGERSIVQSCLNKFSDTPERILKALSDANREVRMVAAGWLCDRNDPTAIAPLKKALKKEKSEATKDVMLRSLEKLGASVDEFFDRDNLLKDSQKLLKKGIPAALTWFPFDAMPAVHWQDTGELVASDLIKGLVVKCFKQKTADPGPIFRRYIDLWCPTDKINFGQFVLTAWIAQDTAPAHTPDEADRMAQQQAQQTYQYFQQALKNNPHMGSYYSATYEELYQQHYNQLMNECAGSAIKEKGVLAFVSVCCSADAVAPIQSYLKTWYGRRAAQCKTLLQILGWIDDNSAIQLLLSVANRFRTKSIQKEAERLINEVAERRGWTRDQLADRTIPTAGFEQGTEQTLDYGERQFTLLLDANMNLILKNSEGKVIKSLPAARKDEDADQVKATKKQLSTTKKQLKQVLKMQRERLYEAMCTQRSWRFADWALYLNQHPIVGRYCQQLVWAVYDGTTLGQTFRPLEDRTLTDVDDEAVTLAPDTKICLAHSCYVPAEVIEAWQTHFADYDVMPLLQQFRASSYELPEAKQNATELDDFEGYLLEAFQLRGLATKRGYTRGQAEDGGCFYEYRKTFNGLGIESVVNFSGNYLPEENHTVALTKLVFEKLPDENALTDYYRRPQMRLGDIPTVLLSEIWNDLQTVANQGSGYDPDWEKKVWN